MFARLIVAFILGCGVAGIYRWTHRGDAAYSPTFVTTLVLMSVLVAIVTQVIGDNSARAFGLLGALAIVRFRTLVRDTRDTAFVVFTVVEGMAIGAGIGGAVINFAIARVAPAAGDAMRQLLTPATRMLLDEAVAAQLVDAIARALRDVYLAAAVAAAVALFFSLRLSGGLSLKHTSGSR